MKREALRCSVVRHSAVSEPLAAFVLLWRFSVLAGRDRRERRWPGLRPTADAARRDVVAVHFQLRIAGLQVTVREIRLAGAVPGRSLALFVLETDLSALLGARNVVVNGFEIAREGGIALKVGVDVVALTGILGSDSDKHESKGEGLH